MPLYPYGPKYGLGLWNSVPGTMVVEIAMFFAGVGLYARSTRARDRWGRWGFWLYVALLSVLFLGDRFSAPPESVSGIAWTGLIATAVLIGWAWWFDRHRSTGEVPVMSGVTQRGSSLEESFD